MTIGASYRPEDQAIIDRCQKQLTEFDEAFIESGLSSGLSQHEVRRQLLESKQRALTIENLSSLMANYFIELDS